MRERKRAEQPAPNGALMVGCVALARAAMVVSLVSGFSWRKAAQAVGREQAPCANVHNRFSLLWRKRALRKRHGKDLTGTKRRSVTVARLANHVVEAMRSRIPR